MVPLADITCDPLGSLRPYDNTGSPSGWMSGYCTVPVAPTPLTFDTPGDFLAYVQAHVSIPEGVNTGDMEAYVCATSTCSGGFPLEGVGLWTALFSEGGLTTSQECSGGGCTDQSGNVVVPPTYPLTGYVVVGDWASPGTVPRAFQYPGLTVSGELLGPPAQPLGISPVSVIEDAMSPVSNNFVDISGVALALGVAVFVLYRGYRLLRDLVNAERDKVGGVSVR